MDHDLGSPEKLRYPGGKDGMYVVKCSCGYQTSPCSRWVHAEKRAWTHKKDKEATEQ